MGSNITTIKEVMVISNKAQYLQVGIVALTKSN